MDIFKTLNLKPTKTEPDVWISRLVIFEQITPEPIITRDIQLSRGLNIVWAEETEEDIPSAEITGHSAGKTTFCRFLRYVLGEKTFGTRANMELIQASLPNGYVAAELHVQGEKWAVLRPIGKGRNSYVKADLSVEELILDRSRPAYLETYAQAIGLEKLLDGLEAGGIVRTGETIQWEHLLAWCTRDQEARFQNIYDWRSPRSESDTPAFRFPKAGPLFLMRVALGLFLPDELKGEEDLARLQQNLESLEKELEKLKREPQLRIDLYDSELRKRLRRILPEYADIESLPFYSGNLLPDLDRFTSNAVNKIEQEISEYSDELKVLQGEIDILGGKIRQSEDQIKTFDGLLNIEGAAEHELDAAVSQRKKTLDLVVDFQDQQCLGGILYRDCDQVKKLHKVLQISQVQDVKAIKEATAERTALQDKIKQQKHQTQLKLDDLALKRRALNEKREKLQTEKIDEKREELRDLKSAHERLKTWISKRDHTGGSKEIDDCRQKLETTATRVKDLEQQLIELLAQHNESRDLLASIFSGAVRSVLSSGTYDGSVSLDNRELGFTITHGSAMSGEAVETLSVLLTDMASLVYTIVSDNARLPGFLLHDSPREADLGNRIYRTFIRFVASLQGHFGETDNCPFQYILTTTTAPPHELQSDRFVKLKLNAAETSELLLRRNIGTTLDRDGGPDLFSAKRGNP
ncbi:MAG: hypothetical protein ACYC69_00660 [Thermodesulfovibrionales bacterium]